MTNLTDTPTAYRDQLTRLARALATARDGEARDALAPGASPEELHLFVADNTGKRLEKLDNQLAFVAQAFDDFDELLRAYVRAVPLAAYATTTSDGDGFLDWLGRARSLTAEQHDYVACQRARHAVEGAARRNRPGHVLFQELAGVAGRLAEELDANPRLRVVLNPIHAWSRFLTPALLGGEAWPPADVLFFAVGNEISTAVLTPRGRAFVRRLARSGPRAAAEWLHGLGPTGRENFVSTCRQLAEVGLLAFA